MATVLLLSYVKFFRVMLTAFSVTQLDYPDSSHELVWLMDPSITYLKGKHIPLFVVGLLIGLLGTAYSLLLFSCRWVLQWSNIRQNRVLALFNAPFTPKNSYWLGLLLLIRPLLFIISAANLLGDPHVNLIAIITILVFLLTLKVMSGRIYKKWQDRHSGNMLYRQPSSLFQFYLLRYRYQWKPGCSCLYIHWHCYCHIYSLQHLHVDL